MDLLINCDSYWFWQSKLDKLLMHALLMNSLFIDGLTDSWQSGGISVSRIKRVIFSNSMLTIDSYFMYWIYPFWFSNTKFNSENVSNKRHHEDLSITTPTMLPATTHYLLTKNSWTLSFAQILAKINVLILLVVDICTHLLLLFKLQLFLSWTDNAGTKFIQLECMQGLKISCDKYILPIGLYIVTLLPLLLPFRLCQ